MSEINISKTSSRADYRKILTALEKSGGKIVDPSDYEQLESHLDQLYIDYNFEGKVITLHLEHYLGISLLSEDADTDDLEKIWRMVKRQLQLIEELLIGGVIAKGMNRIGKAVLKVFKDPTSKRPRGVPKDWKKRPSRKNDGIIYEKPGTKGTTNVRVMKEKPNSKNPGQRTDYVTWQKGRKNLDKNGNIVPKQSRESHIPLKDFKFNLEKIK